MYVLLLVDRGTVKEYWASAAPWKTMTPELVREVSGAAWMRARQEAKLRILENIILNVGRGN